VTLELVQGDTAPAINSTIVKKSDLSVIDLTGAAVRFQMRKPDDRRFTVNAAATIVDPVAGTVTYSWATNDLSVPGEYVIQWEVTYPDTRIQTTSQETVIVRRQ
jgi:hypothetical protein